MNLLMTRSKFILLLMVAIIGLYAAMVSTPSAAFSNNFAVIMLKDLPKEARDTYALIKIGGPFPYSKDGSIFSNREARLPKKKRGYWREYTVKTPGVRNRGARRIVCGAESDCFYTSDHYATFSQIQEK